MQMGLTASSTERFWLPRLYLRLLKQEFESYFPDFGETGLPKWKTTRNLLRLNMDILDDGLQEELLEQCR